MRNIHSYLIAEYGKESVGIYWRWGKFEYKMADFQNHRWFSLRHLSKGIILTSVKLKTNIKTPKGKYIVRKAEISLLNERIRSINNSIAMFKTVRDTCINQLESIVDEATMEECHMYIERREQRHQKTKERHLSKFYRFCLDQRDGHSYSWHGEHGNTHTCINADTTTDTCTNNNEASNTPNQDLRPQNTSNNNNNNNQGCWVRNFSKTPLTDAQQSLPKS